MQLDSRLPTHVSIHIMAATPTNCIVLPATNQLVALLTIIRDRETKRGDFIFYSDRVIRLLVEEGLNHLPVVPKCKALNGCSTFGKDPGK